MYRQPDGAGRETLSRRHRVAPEQEQARSRAAEVASPTLAGRHAAAARPACRSVPCSAHPMGSGPSCWPWQCYHMHTGEGQNATTQRDR